MASYKSDDEPLEVSVSFVKSFRHAIDVGANKGIWTRRLATMFARVTAFEPVPENCVQLQAAVAALPNVTLINKAAFDANGPQDFNVNYAGYAQRTRGRKKTHTFECVRIDNFGFEDVDYIKIDADGSDANVLLGALETIGRSRPVVHIETKYLPGGERLRETIGYDLAHAFKADEVWVPK